MTEQTAFAAAAREQTFGAGVVLWRQNQCGDHVIVIRSGKAHISIEDTLGDRIIATRGAGNIVGERVALRPGSRSATVVTTAEVRSFVIGTAEFRVFIGEHLRVLTDVLERQIYRRLTEDHLDKSIVTESGVAALPMLSSLHWTGQNCTICLTDITAFSASSRRDEDRRSMRMAMYRMLEDAFSSSGAMWNSCYSEDRGDGTLIIMPPSIPTSVAVNAVAVRLAAALRQHNRQVSAATGIALRVAIHVGPVTTDSRGVSGHAIDHTARLVEAAPLKKRVAQTSADLGLAVSEFVHDTVISPNHRPDELAVYQRIQFQAKESRAVAWIHLSGAADLGKGNHL
ncbi:MAG TPA: cyclic nucleotide-binding domain-containing protein, partial [Chthonomonadales bacterium]|nr:cyclic nucleotide-binding domain-containing protein [Chthonomonadales bacterium]